MARQNMPKTGVMQPFIVLNRDAAVAGVFSVDGEAGSIDLTGKYLQISNYNTDMEALNLSLADINAKLELRAMKGNNSDITNLTGLTGALRLGADASSDNQAVTLRQMISAIAAGGSGGPTLTGVMNNFLGAVEWFNGSRAAMPAGHLPADGQLLNRADYPELWNAISSGIFISVDDATWLNSSGAQYVHRGKYSTGNGTTTFRMPDLNGKISGSIIPFLRGDGGGTSVGVVYESGAPNISGVVGNIWSSKEGAGEADQGPAASPLRWNNRGGTSRTTLQNTNPGSSGMYDMSFDASRSNAIYGRANEVRPQNVIGIWLIRVNGLFSAANTNFNVINAVTTLPANGSVVYGGDSRSVLQVNGADYLSYGVRSRLTVGGEKAIEFRLIDSSNSSIVTNSFTFSPTAITLREASGAGSNNNRNSINYRVETAQSYGVMRAYRNNADGGLVFQTSQDGGTAQNFFMTGLGNFALNGQIFCGNVNAKGQMVVYADAPNNLVQGSFYNAPGLQSRLDNRGSASPYSVLYFQEQYGVRHSAILNLNGFNSNYDWAFRSGGSIDTPLGTVAVQGSDVRLKTDIVPAKEGAGERLDKIGIVEFEMITTGERQRGFIAQQLYTVDSYYTFSSELPTSGEDEDGQPKEAKFIMNVRDRSILADVVAEIQSLRARIKELESK